MQTRRLTTAVRRLVLYSTTFCENAVLLTDYPYWLDWLRHNSAIWLWVSQTMSCSNFTSAVLCCVNDDWRAVICNNLVFPHLSIVFQKNVCLPNNQFTTSAWHCKVKDYFPRCFNFTNDFLICVIDICSEYFKGDGKQRLLGGNIRHHIVEIW